MLILELFEVGGVKCAISKVVTLFKENYKSILKQLSEKLKNGVKIVETKRFLSCCLKQCFVCFTNYSRNVRTTESLMLFLSFSQILFKISILFFKC